MTLYHPKTFCRALVRAVFCSQRIHGVFRQHWSSSSDLVASRISVSHSKNSALGNKLSLHRSRVVRLVCSTVAPTTRAPAGAPKTTEGSGPLPVIMPPALRCPSHHDCPRPIQTPSKTYRVTFHVPCHVKFDRQLRILRGRVYEQWEPPTGCMCETVIFMTPSAHPVSQRT